MTASCSAVRRGGAAALRGMPQYYTRRSLTASQRRLSVREAGSRSTLTTQLSLLRRALSDGDDCDGTVIRGAQTLDEHRGLRRHTEWAFWQVKSLIVCPFARCGVS